MSRGFILCQSWYYHSKATKTPIYIFALVESFPRSTCNSNSLRACKINQIKFGHFDFLPFPLSIVLSHLLDCNDKNCVRPWRKLIHVCLSSCSWFGAHFNKFHNLFGFDNCPLGDSFYIHTLSTIFTDLKIVLLMPQKIANNLVINLNIRCSHHKLRLFVLAFLNVSENIFNCSWNNSTLLVVQIVFESFHCVRFSSACLPIGKDCRIVTFQCWAYW